ncbi:sigma 54-interacting transcriptional regulator [Thalassotalea profundi]|uniref:HTH-type transcriptional regulatory protein TyrR n=1 Tax=Thalassotalea profundi TaxID=2036687 RepID=A0ABQ3INM6_9GAMM|nr:sigma 54-interacting transcriptional regulator [Thalassotalea profundi]GHE86721.1 Fis family transcriptional regulator [Thalassotalea profundi]
MKVEIKSSDRIGISQEILAVFAGKSWNVKAIEVQRHFTFVYIDSDVLKINEITDSLSHIEGVKGCKKIDLMPSELRENHLSTLLSRIPDPIIDLDSKGNILALNRAADKLFSSEQKSIVGQSIEKYTDINLKNINKPNEHSVSIKVLDTHYIADVSPVVANKKIKGAVITLRSIKKLGRQLSMIQSTIEQGIDNILGESETIQLVISQTLRFAELDLPVLISGETGTGKELFARALHQSSQRKNGPFLTINCASLPEQLLESELFGYESGAFTGASKSGKPGLFELAAGGTVFLDEIAEMSVYLQAKLLRFLQDYRFRRVGGTKEFIADIKIVSASHQNFNQLIEDKKFREDLYYRLNVLRLELPSLAKRSDDIPMLVNHFVKNAATHVDQIVPIIANDAMAALKAYSWPGNIRQLENTIFRLVALNSNKEITRDDVNAILYQSDDSSTIKIVSQRDVDDWASAQANFEKQLLTELYPHYPTTRKLAKRLKVSHNKIAMKLRAYNIE